MSVCGCTFLLLLSGGISATPLFSGQNVFKPKSAVLLHCLVCDWLIPVSPQKVGDALTDFAAVVKPILAHTSGLSARQPVTTALVAVEPLALPQTRFRTLPALTQAGVGVQRLALGTLCGAHAAAQVVVPPLARGTPLPLALTFTLAFTGVVVQLPARIAAVLGESVSTHALAG